MALRAIAGDYEQLRAIAVPGNLISFLRQIGKAFFMFLRVYNEWAIFANANFAWANFAHRNIEAHWELPM